MYNIFIPANISISFPFIYKLQFEFNVLYPTIPQKRVYWKVTLLRWHFILLINRHVDRHDSHVIWHIIKRQLLGVKRRFCVSFVFWSCRQEKTLEFSFRVYFICTLSLQGCQACVIFSLIFLLLSFFSYLQIDIYASLCLILGCNNGTIFHSFELDPFVV